MKINGFIIFSLRFKFLSIFGAFFILLSCASSAPPASPTNSSNNEKETETICDENEEDCSENSVVSGTGPVSDSELCETLKDSSKNQGIYSEKFFKREVDFLCSSVAGKAELYDGNGSPSYVGTPEEKDDTTDIFLMGSVTEVPAKANQFYQMMDMQLNRTSDFESHSLGFEGDDKVTYTVINSKDLNSSIVETNYDYKYEDTEDPTKNWSYKGRSNLITIESNRYYVIANRHTDGTDRLLEFKGLKVIVESSRGSKLFYVSYQEMDTDGGSGRDKTRSSVDSGMKDELAKDFRNGVKAKDL